MSEFDEIQNLIRLKRHERPPESFVEDFVVSFQERQRAEMLHRSARGLLWERVTTYFSDLLNPKWAWVGATACAVLALGLGLRPPQSATGSLVGGGSPDGFEVKGFAATDPNAFKADVESYLKAIETQPGDGSGSNMIQRPRVVPVRGGAGLSGDSRVIPVSGTPTVFIVQP